MSVMEVNLGPVQETLLIPLLGRADQTRRRTGLINDPKAIEIVESLDYDFSKWEGTPSLLGASIRTRMFDEFVKDFLGQWPHGTVVEIGAGLNTRYERIDNGKANWLEVDLPDSMALRKTFFQETERRRMISASVLDSDWHEEVKTMSAPYCFVSEAVVIYLSNDQARQALGGLAKQFPGSWLVTDTTSTTMVESQHKHDAMKKMPQDSWFQWKCDDPSNLAEWGLRLEKSETFVDASDEIREAVPFSYRALLFIAPWIVRKMMNGYFINRFTLSPV